MSLAVGSGGGRGGVAGGGSGGLGTRGWLRWAWRQLTSMRVALLLLLVLAIVSLPGSFFPQRSQDAGGVAEFERANPDLSVWLDRLWMFEVYTSPWFSAVYLLLFVSLVGCIVPRSATYLRALRAGPGPVPRVLSRFPEHAELVVDGDPEGVLERVRARLGRRGPVRADGRGLSHERGRSHEAGNLVFHIALVGVMLSFAAGQLVSYRGQALVVEGGSFANSVLDYDSFTSGALVDPADLDPFTLRLHEFASQFTWDGQPRDFRAAVTARTPAGEREEVVRVNHPLELGDTRVYLSGNGYAPVLTVRDATGEVALSGPVPFLPQDTTYTSRGVVKVPDVGPGQDQLGMVGVLLPTAVQDAEGTWATIHPEPRDPAIVMEVWEGDLGLDEGVPQNVYQLETAELTRLAGEDGEPFQLELRPGQSVELPGGRGSVTYESTDRFASFDLRHDPTLGWLGATAIAALLGLTVSLGVTRRRVWVTAEPAAPATGAPGGAADEGGPRTLVRVAALARGEDVGLAQVVEDTAEVARGR